MKILVFGAAGMLGRYVSSYLSKSHSVIRITRADIELTDPSAPEMAEKLIDEHLPKAIVNCAGVIDPRSGDCKIYVVNSYFPVNLSKICEKRGIKLFHPSTDCVFSGSKLTPYPEDHPTDPRDDYGKSKVIAETINACVLRTSIIGEGGGLLEWVRSTNGGEATGYTNHLWNGITCLEYAKLIKLIIDSEDWWVGVRNIQSTYNNKAYISKYDLVREIALVYNIDLVLNPDAAESFVNRSLVGSFITKDIVEQIRELYSYEL